MVRRQQVQDTIPEIDQCSDCWAVGVALQVTNRGIFQLQVGETLPLEIGRFSYAFRRRRRGSPGMGSGSAEI